MTRSAKKPHNMSPYLSLSRSSPPQKNHVTITPSPWPSLIPSLFPLPSHFTPMSLRLQFFPRIFVDGDRWGVYALWSGLERVQPPCIIPVFHANMIFPPRHERVSVPSRSLSARLAPLPVGGIFCSGNSPSMSRAIQGLHITLHRAWFNTIPRHFSYICLPLLCFDLAFFLYQFFLQSNDSFGCLSITDFFSFSEDPNAQHISSPADLCHQATMQSNPRRPYFDTNPYRYKPFIAKLLTQFWS